MDAELLGAFISGFIALIVALVALVQTQRNQSAQSKAQEKLESLKLELSEQLAEGDARRDYEYESRKRLYAEVGPLFFQLIELWDAAIQEIRRLCNPDHWHRLKLSEESRESLNRTGWIGSTSYDTVFASCTRCWLL